MFQTATDSDTRVHNLCRGHPCGVLICETPSEITQHSRTAFDTDIADYIENIQYWWLTAEPSESALKSWDMR